MKSFFEKIKNAFAGFNNAQKIACGVLAVALVATVGLRASALSGYDDKDSTSISQLFSSITSMYSMGPSYSSEESKPDVEITLKASSVEEDLEVQIVDEKGNLVVGPEFTLTVKAKNGSYNKDWKVNDGFLKLTKIDGGEYIVTIRPLKGYIVPADGLECKVEKKVAYKEVDVKELLVDDNKVDSQKEDAGYTQTPTAPPVERLTDTVEFVPSSSRNGTENIDKYKPVYVSGGNADSEGNYEIQLDNGQPSGVYIVVDRDGYAVSGYRWERQEVEAASAPNTGNGEPGEGTDGSDNPSQEDPSSSTSDPETPSTPDPEPSSTPDPDPSTPPESSSEPIASEPVSSDPTPSSSESQSSDPAPSSSSENPDPSQSDSSSDSTGSSSSDVYSGDSSSSTSSSQSSGSSETEYRDVKVPVDIFGADKTPVKDELGNSIFKFNEEQIEQPTTIYYGWQTLNGKRYYFDKNGKKVTGTQVIQGVTYYFDVNGVMGNRLGIDVSKYQGNIDWAKVKASGVDYAIIRVGYRGYGTGVLVEDPTFRRNIQGATAAGIKVGVYVFSQAITTQEAVEEASLCLEATRGYGLALPIFFDSEYSTSRRSGRADHLSQSQRTKIAIAFCETVRNGGRAAGIYASKTWFYYQLNYSEISRYSIWVAHYARATDFRYHYDIWQYSGSGRCAGISGAVDMNLIYAAY